MNHGVVFVLMSRKWGAEARVRGDTRSFIYTARAFEIDFPPTESCFN